MCCTHLPLVKPWGQSFTPIHHSLSVVHVHTRKLIVIRFDTHSYMYMTEMTSLAAIAPCLEEINTWTWLEQFFIGICLFRLMVMIESSRRESRGLCCMHVLHTCMWLLYNIILLPVSLPHWLCSSFFAASSLPSDDVPGRSFLYFFFLHPDDSNVWPHHSPRPKCWLENNNYYTAPMLALVYVLNLFFRITFYLF